MSLQDDLERLKPALADAAQKVVDEWQQDEEGIDPELGHGGVCDRVAEAMLDTIYSYLQDVDGTFGSFGGEDHEWIVVSDGNEAFIIDISPYVYETGSGYSWRKIENAKINPNDVLIDPLEMELAKHILTEGELQMNKKLTVLADALKTLGENNSALLVLALGRGDLNIDNQTWLVRFFEANPEFMDRAEKFAETEGINFSSYINTLEKMPEDVGRKKIHNDLGYAGISWLPVKRERPEEVVTETEVGELVWPFPAPHVLKNPAAFVAAALAYAPSELRAQGKRGEIKAARLYLRYLMKDIAPNLAKSLQKQWNVAAKRNDVSRQDTLRLWWQSLTDVWYLLQRMIKIINRYEIEA
jgi:hypothetical protein